MSYAEKMPRRESVGSTLARSIRKVVILVQEALHMHRELTMSQQENRS